MFYYKASHFNYNREEWLTMLYPINLEIKDMKITIIGGGDVAYRKCKNFLEFGRVLELFLQNLLIVLN